MAKREGTQAARVDCEGRGRVGASRGQTWTQVLIVPWISHHLIHRQNLSSQLGNLRTWTNGRFWSFERGQLGSMFSFFSDSISCVFSV